MPSPAALRPAAPSAAPRAPHASRRTGRRTGRALALGALAAATLAACGGTDPFAPKASRETTLDSLVVYPLSTTSTLFPTAVDLLGRQVVRPRVSSGVLLNFDFAVDRDARGRLLLVPPKLLASPPGGAPQTGFQLATTGFDATESAPRGGYQYDSSLAVTTGQTVVVQAQGVPGLTYGCTRSSPLYAKLVVQAIDATTGAVTLRVRTNPNCGFRSFASGVPTF